VCRFLSMDNQAFGVVPCAGPARVSRPPGPTLSDSCLTRTRTHRMEGTLLRIAVPLSGETFCAHFGGADRFAIFEGDREHTTITSRHDATPPPHEHGSFPLWLRSQGVTAVIAGGMGARAVQMLDHFGIEVVLGVGGGDPDTLAAAFLKGEIRSTGSSCSGHGLHRCHDHGDSTG